MASLANKDEAEKCRDMAKKFLGRGEREKAVRFFEKSLKLYPLPGVEAMRDLAKSGLGQGEAPSGPSSKSYSNASTEQARPSSAPFSANTNGHMPNSSGTRSNFNGDARGSPGARRRPAAGAGAAGGAANGGAPAATNNGAGGGGSGRAYTEEQERAVKKVIDSKAKGHYAVLGVEKDATEDQIKRAYRKLALKFHPDKNGAPKAHEAFQAIGTAFAVLSDAEKRAHYDRFGDDDGPQGMAGGFGRAGGPFGAHARYRAGPEVSPQDIFNMFFGEMGQGGEEDIRRGGAGPFRVYRAGGGVRGRRAQQQQGGSVMNLLALIPFIVLTLLTIFTGQQEDIFRLKQTSTYHVEKLTTRNTGVVEGIRYYVGPGFRQQYGRSREQIRKVESQVTSAYKNHLRSECFDMQARREQRMTKVRQRRRTMSSEAFEQLMIEAESMPLPACEELKSKFNFYSNYH